MLPEHHVGTRHAREEVIVDHGPCAADRLLGGLDEEDEGPGPAAACGREAVCGTQQAGGVHVVPAGVHHTVGGAGVRQAGRLGDRQGVHVSAQQHARPVTVAQDADDAGAADALDHLDHLDHLEAEVAQPGRGDARGAVLLPGQLGMRVQVAVDVGEPCQQVVPVAT